MLKYKVIEIFTSEEARWQGKPLGDAVLRYICDAKIAARCMVTRGTDGCYENGEIASRKIEVISYNMPVHIRIILPAADLDRVLPEIEKMVTDGIVALHTLDVVGHKTQNRFVPRHVKVREVMTTNPRTAGPSTSLSEVVTLLLSEDFTGIPIVDADNRPVGVISQGDLINRAGMPLRLCLLAESDQDRVDSFLDTMSSRTAWEIMSTPAVCIEEDRPLTEAVELMMLQKRLKRLPVVDDRGKLTGILSCMDIFRLITQKAPDWQAFRDHDIQVENLTTISYIMRRDTHKVLPHTPIEEIIGIIHSDGMGRVAVVDSEGHYLGIVSDENLLAVFSDYRASLWDYIVSKVPFGQTGRKYRELIQQLKARTAGEVMDSDHITIREGVPIEEAIRLIAENDLKRLPVLDDQGRYQGMVNRESLLRTGFAQCKACKV